MGDKIKYQQKYGNKFANIIPYRAKHAHPQGMHHGMPEWVYKMQKAIAEKDSNKKIMIARTMIKEEF